MSDLRRCHGDVNDRLKRLMDKDGPVKRIIDPCEKKAQVEVNDETLGVTNDLDVEGGEPQLEKEWFADLLLLLTQPPLALPCWDKLLRQPHCSLFHQGVHALNLHAWRLSSDTTESRAFQEELLESCQGSSESPPLDCTNRDGNSSVVGVVDASDHPTDQSKGRERVQIQVVPRVAKRILEDGLGIRDKRAIQGQLRVEAGRKQVD